MLQVKKDGCGLKRCVQNSCRNVCFCFFAEGEEEEEEGDDTDSGRPQSLKSIASSNHRRVSVTLDRFTGDSLLHFSYSPAAGSMGLGPPDSQLGGSFVTAFSQGLSLNTSLNAPFLHQNLSPSGESSHLFPTAARNPNKAIVTIDAQSSLISILYHPKMNG